MLSFRGLSAALCALVELKLNSMKVTKLLLLVVLNVLQMLLKYCCVAKHFIIRINCGFCMC